MSLRTCIELNTTIVLKNWKFSIHCEINVYTSIGGKPCMVVHTAIPLVIMLSLSGQQPQIESTFVEKPSNHQLLDIEILHAMCQA